MNNKQTEFKRGFRAGLSAHRRLYRGTSAPRLIDMLINLRSWERNYWDSNPLLALPYPSEPLKQQMKYIKKGQKVWQGDVAHWVKSHFLCDRPCPHRISFPVLPF